MRMNKIIWHALQALLKLNDYIYGVGATREVLRDLYGCHRNHGE